MLRLSCAALGLGTFFFSLSTVILLDDHFGRISPGRQIAQYGDLPFRDFLDPGYFLTEFSSAAVQWLFGDNLLGEALLASAFIATGTVLVFVLARRVSASSITALAAAVLALLLFPRAYDYDKVLFLPLGILLCWRYVDAPAASRIWAMAAGAVAGSLYRYDTGIFIVGATVVAMAVLHAGAWTTLARRLGYFGMARRMLAHCRSWCSFSTAVASSTPSIKCWRTADAKPHGRGCRYGLGFRSRPGQRGRDTASRDSILIRWAPQVDDEARIAAEARHGLVEGRLRGAARGPHVGVSHQ